MFLNRLFRRQKTAKTPEPSAIKSFLGSESDDYSSPELFWTALASTLIAFANAKKEYTGRQVGFNQHSESFIRDARLLATSAEALAILAREEPRRGVFSEEVISSEERLKHYEKFAGLSSYFQDKPALQEHVFLPWLSAKDGDVMRFWTKNISDLSEADSRFKKRYVSELKD